MNIAVFIMKVKESAIAKSVGKQKKGDMTFPDTELLRVFDTGLKVSKRNAHYRGQMENGKKADSCRRCKFNLGDEKKCHIVAGKINDNGVSKFFSPKGNGMLPGDIVWEFVKRANSKLRYQQGHVIREGAPGFQCKDCKYYLYSGSCLLIEGIFKPKMSCGFIVKIGQGTKI
jgi:hypothetical protein